MEFVNSENHDHGILAYSVHPGGVLTDLARAGMPESMHAVLNDTPELAGDTICWLTSERRDWLAGRYLSCNFDMKEFLAKRDEIEAGDLLKIRMAVE